MRPGCNCYHAYGSFLEDYYDYNEETDDDDDDDDDYKSPPSSPKGPLIIA
ncbi:hypothetical protein TRIUR3_14022 [Triticum urartu]|uniref:Uncharacterized protein n=1 Tax=Triticum urartu TaxID=4572 RepID=M7YRD6_TRIUA|nr:hypothetical protein TRIUR3_14022 [Triticum urartu]